MKNLLLLLLAVMLAMPVVAQKTYACPDECVPAEEATEETPEEDVCADVSGMVHMNPNVMRHAFLMSYVNRLEDLGGAYVEGMNRFEVMRAIFEIEKGL